MTVMVLFCPAFANWRITDRQKAAFKRSFCWVKDRNGLNLNN